MRSDRAIYLWFAYSSMSKINTTETTNEEKVKAFCKALNERYSFFEEEIKKQGVDEVAFEAINYADEGKVIMRVPLDSAVTCDMMDFAESHGYKLHSVSMAMRDNKKYRYMRVSFILKER